MIALLLAYSKENCNEAVHDLVMLFKNPGFYINDKKSQLIPDTKLTFLVFDINSQNIRVLLTQEKKEVIGSNKVCQTLEM